MLRVVEFPTRRGKAAVLNDLVAASTADILVFTDANTRFEPGAVARPRRARFADPRVGAACGRLVFEAARRSRADTRDATSGTARRGSRRPKGSSASCLGANGGDLRGRGAALVAPLPPDTTSMDDFLIPARIARAGRSVVFAGEAVAREDTARDVAAEVAATAADRHRRRAGPSARASGSNAAARPAADACVRLAQGGALDRARFSPSRRRPSRSSAPELAGRRRPRPGACGRWLLALAKRGPSLPGLTGRLYYFVVLNLASALGVAAGLFGHSSSRLDADGALLMASRPAVRIPARSRSPATSRSRAACLYAAFFLRTHVAIPGTLAPAAGRQRALHGWATSSIVAAVQVFALSLFGLYRDHERFREPLARLLLPALFVELLTLASIYFLAQPYSFPRSVLVIFVCSSTACCSALAHGARPPLPAARGGAP